ncbi:MAG TPA: hypothetical protein VEZ90_00720, partial [Blastocatellia bacterium]|nr:hypothetical protein [Blastocatellia bacterium]
MTSDFIKQFLQDHKTIILGIAAVAAVGLIVISLYLRGRKRGRRTELAEEVGGHENEERFVAAVENLPYSVDSAQVVSAIADAFRQYLSVNIAAIYATQGGGAIYRNLAASGGTASGWLPGLSAEVVRRYPRTQLASSSAFRVGGGGTGALPALQGAMADALGGVNREGGQGGAAVPPPVQPLGAFAETGRSVAVLPWQAPFDWKGLIICDSQGPIDMDSLARVYHPQGPAGAHLGVALQLEKWQSGLRAAGEQSARIGEFVTAAMTAAEGAVDLQGVLRSVTRFLGGDSSAYWRIDLQSRTLRMVA